MGHHFGGGACGMRGTLPPARPARVTTRPAARDAAFCTLGVLTSSLCSVVTVENCMLIAYMYSEF